MKRALLLFLLATLSAPAAVAGDPCPIDFGVVNLGKFNWDKKTPTKDPLFRKLLAQANHDGCAHVVSRSNDTDGWKVNLGKGVDLATDLKYTAILDEKKAFRCKDAHVVLKPLANVLVDGVPLNVVYQRGSRRILIAVIGWGTTCVDIKDLKTDADFKKLWVKATKKYVDDRYANP